MEPTAFPAYRVPEGFPEGTAAAWPASLEARRSQLVYGWLRVLGMDGGEATVAGGVRTHGNRRT